MKIIKRGVLPQERVWSGTCHTCGTQAECFEAELKVTHDQRDGTFGQTDCPVCNERMCFYPLPQGTTSVRTREQVLAERENAVSGGCCERFANNMRCDCLPKAVCSICSNPECDNPNGKH